MKNIIKNYIEFYKQNLKKKHLISIIVCLIVFVIFLIADIQEYSGIELSIPKESYLDNLSENAMLSFIIIFAGITPYCFLSVLGFSAMYGIASKVALIYVVKGSLVGLILNCILVLIASVAYSLCIATGIHYCSLSSKKFTYSQKKGFKFSDLKLSIYKLRKNENKIEELEEKKKLDYEKAEKLNVKIPYMNLAISLIISIVILALTGIFI